MRKEITSKMKNFLSSRIFKAKSGTLFPEGHFYSPLPFLEEIRLDSEKIFVQDRNLPAMDLNEQEQLELLKKISVFYQEIPFTEKKSQNRYFFANDFYSYSDAIFLYSFMRYIKPKKIIEIGSGFSTCVMLDTNEFFFNNSINIECIEPYPELLISLLRINDKKLLTLREKRLQDIDLAEFRKLDSGDILFIDSTHVAKVNSDVNYILHEILPSLKSGVYIHFHDIFYPFEYPKDWIFQGKAWNEIYILRAFLEYNQVFKIILFNTFLEYKYPDFFSQNMPLCLKNKGGSIWLKKM